MGKADLHLHTSVSDGLASVGRTLEYIEHQTDLDVIAITDHEDATGGLRARELAAQRGYRFEVVVGAEITTRQGHLLALFIEDTPKSFRSVEATLEAIHAQGGLAIIPHPMSWLTRSLGERTIERVTARAEPGITFDGIELCNPSPAGRRTRDGACEGNLRWQLPATGASDAHHLVHVGTGWTEFDGHTADDLREALRRGETEARMSRYPSLREVGIGRTALGLAWGYSATPRKMLRWRRRSNRA
ncbi:MAG: phosphotransferase [Dehalococcoidia bacterium]|nr:phosphotransferase [Dehalococcoidia bacterium]